jgi:hypothetical protein
VAANAETIGKQGLLGKSVPVYDLMVEGDHEFFANGVLVHNCIESLAYVNQMAITTYADPNDYDDEPEVLEVVCGF